MNFTFGIITNGENKKNLIKVINSIHKLNIPNYEIIIVGNIFIESNKTIIINFDENIKKSWVTKKKNIITSTAKFENIVYLHDYIIFNKDWYLNFLNFGNDFEICMNQILNKDGTRFRDWTIWPHNGIKIDDIVNENKECLLPYHVTNLTKLMYISGSYWVAKKYFMLNYPLNENLSWGEGEDVEWSKVVREVTNFQCNSNSKVILLKYKDPAFKIVSDLTLDKINSTYFHNS